MSKKFPHLNDTDFPGTDINPYNQYENNVDYDAYSSKQRIKICAVKWNIDSDDRVKWDSDTERDAWFDNLKGAVFDLESAINIIPETSIKIPVPYYAFQNCNYLMVTQPKLPNEDATFDYGGSGVLRYFYYVVSARYAAPSTTEIVVQLDNWTTYVNQADITRISITRGHYATTLTTVADYLSDPLTHSQGLTEPEDTLTPPVKISSADWIPAMTGAPWLLFAVNCTFDQLQSLRKADAAVATSPAQYTDGAHPAYDVSGYTWGGMPQVDDAVTPVQTGISADSTVINGFTVFAVKAAEAYSTNPSFFGYIKDNYPQFFNLIYATYIVNEDCLTFGDNYKLGNFSIYKILPSNDSVIYELDLTPEKFGYNEHYKKLTKLYTYPYADIILDDNNGNMTRISIENIADSFKVCERINILYPYVNCNIFAANIGGKAIKSLKWIDLNNVTHDKQIPDYGYSNILSDYDIPTYTLYVPAADVWNLNNRASSVTNARENAITAYHATNSSADTALVTTQRSIKTGQDNTNSSATTSKNNIIRSNAIAITNQSLGNNLNTTITNNSNTASTDILNQSLVAQETTYNASKTKIQDLNKASLNLTQNMVNTEVTASAMSNVTATVGTLAGAATGIAVTAATGGAMAPMIGTALGAAGSVALSGVSFATGTSKSVDEATAKLTYNLAAMNATIAYNESAYSAGTNQQRYANMKNSSLNSDNTTATNNTNSAVAKNNADTSNSNASATYNTAVANAKATADTGNANAATSNANTLAIAQRNMSMAQRNYVAQLDDLRRQKAIGVTQATGDPLPDMRHVRGVQVRIMTQSDDVIRRVGDSFLRYGYRWHGNVDNPQLNINRNFTFWEGVPTVTGAIPYAAIRDIATMFENGVTVWRDPDKIGNSIYDN